MQVDSKFFQTFNFISTPISVGGNETSSTVIGPASFVEENAGMPIIDASPDVCEYLTGAIVIFLYLCPRQA